MKYTLKSVLCISYKKQDTESKSVKGGTHLYVRDHIVRQLEKLFGPKESELFRRKVDDLKKHRIESDYRDIEINIEKGETALRKAREIKRYLTQTFEL